VHASDGGVRAALAPLFDEFHVGLVVQGHRRHRTTYVCIGSGGRPRRPFQDGETQCYRG
jgi:hypothetical protein